jgi:hypothetical protein
MSLIDKNNLSYLTEVEQYFLNLKGAGLSLSGVDYDLISKWEARGIPARQLCHAISASVAEFRHKHGATSVHGLSLGRIERFIEDEIEGSTR